MCNIDRESPHEDMLDTGCPDCVVATHGGYRMNLPQLTKQVLTVCLAAQMALITPLSTAAEAKMLSTEAAISKYSTYADRDFLLSELNKQEIRDEIIALGVDPAEAEARLKALTDKEIASIIIQIEDDSAGAGVVGALLTVFLVLLVTDLLCLTKFFNFTRCAR